MSDLKIVIAIPEQQHSYELVSSLRRNKFDVTYITSTYFKQNSCVLKVLRLILPHDLAIRAGKRHCDGIEDENVRVFYFWLGLFELFMMRISTKLYRKIRTFKGNLFEKKVARYVKKNKVDVLILYEDYCSTAFEKLADYPVIKVVDCSAAAKSYMKEIYEKDSDGSLINEFKDEYPVLWNGIDMIEGIKKADRLMVPSMFSKKSYMATGISAEKIVQINYPMDLSLIESIKNDDVPNDRFSFAYSGQVTHRKGIHHLLHCFEKLNSEAELHLYGPYKKKSSLYEQYADKEYLFFHGWTNKEILLPSLTKSSVFVFPSLADSMSFSVLEAMALGIPVICTDNTGASEFITNYQNGIVVKAGDEEELLRAMNWCIENQSALKVMGNKARESIKELVGKSQYDYKVRRFIDSLDYSG